MTSSNGGVWLFLDALNSEIKFSALSAAVLETKKSTYRTAGAVPLLRVVVHACMGRGPAIGPQETE